MAEARRGSPFVGAALEAVAWFALAGAFLATYVRSGASASSIVPHLHLVADLAIALAALRVLVALSPLPRALARGLSTGLLFAAWTSLALLYIAAIVGLRSWGRVTTWELIVSYVPQARGLLDAVGVPWWVPVAALVAVLGVLGLLAAFARRWDWVDPAARKLSRAMRAGVVIAFVAALGDMYRVLAVPPVTEQEPLSLIFFPEQATVQVQSQSLDQVGTMLRGEAEDRARAAYKPAAQFRRRNVVLIVSDALRADHMGVYGYARSTTPYLARMKAEGRARVAPPVLAACSESQCGLLSLASSRYVHEFATRMFLLPEVLARHGYRTAMVLSGDHTHFYGLKERYGAVDSFFDASHAGGEYMNDDRLVVSHLQGWPAWDGRPLLLQMHLMSSHMLGKREGTGPFEPAANYFFVPNQMENGKPSPRAINYYDNGVRQMDAVVERIVKALAGKGYLDDAIVIVTGDHGEGLGEHGIWGHSNAVYEEFMRVPFVMLDFGAPGAPIDGRVVPSQVDLAPTILADLGIPQPETWNGQALQRGASAPFAFFAERSLSGVLDRRDPARPWKYWEDFATGAAWAYDLAADPGETRNLAGQVPAERLRDWKRELVPIRARYMPEVTR